LQLEDFDLPWEAVSVAKSNDHFDIVDALLEDDRFWGYESEDDSDDDDDDEEP
jgi:hypothetical protein